MSKFSQRSKELELMDLPIDDERELFLNLRELEVINTLTGGPSLVFKHIQLLFNTLKLSKNDEIHIADIGYGAGDMLLFLINNKDKLPCKIKLTGVDLMPEAESYALQMHPELEKHVNFVLSDYEEWFQAGNQPDLIVAGLFCHHLSDEQLIQFFSKISKNTKYGAIINDLQRHPIAYYGIKYLTKIFSKSRFTKNDAPLSVLRGFKKKEIESLMQKGNVTQFSIQWKWAFRYLIKIAGTK
jgi:ubiquinone/menaquinone biosynthesis C-methylase UbiE